MPTYRKFWLINNNNDTISFNECDIFGFEPSGLGLNFSNDYVEYNATFIPVEQLLNQNQLDLSILVSVMKKQSYIDYFNFTNDFLNYQPYTLKYETTAGTYQRKCQLSSISKTELTLTHGLLEEDLKLDYITPWYIEITNKQNLSDDESDSTNDMTDEDILCCDKIYFINSANSNTGYAYSYIYGGAKSPGGPGTSFWNISNQSKMFGYDVDSPLEITITANSTITNPSWDLYVGGQIVYSDGFFLTLEPGHSITVSSYPEDQQAILIDQSGSSSPIYQLQDFTKTNFIEIPPGNSVLIFNFSDATITWTYRQQYLVV